MIHVAIDIDGTIAGRQMQRFASVCNQEFHLGLASDDLVSIRYKDFMRLPALLAYRQQIGEDAFQRAVKQIEQDPEMLRALPPLPDAVEGVRHLAALGSVAYYTVRQCETSAVQHQQLQQATREWLCEHQFPGEVIFCRSLLNKLVRIAHQVQDSGQPVVLVDDRFEDILQQFGDLKTGALPGADPSTCQRLVEVLTARLLLVAFRSSSAPSADAGLQVLPLPSWKQVQDFIASLNHHFFRSIC